MGVDYNSNDKKIAVLGNILISLIDQPVLFPVELNIIFLLKAFCTKICLSSAIAVIALLSTDGDFIQKLLVDVVCKFNF